MYDTRAISAHDLPFVASQLDTIAEHDLNEGSAAISDDTMADARASLSHARELILDACVLLGIDTNE